MRAGKARRHALAYRRVLRLFFQHGDLICAGYVINSECMACYCQQARKRGDFKKMCSCLARPPFQNTRCSARTIIDIPEVSCTRTPSLVISRTVASMALLPAFTFSAWPTVRTETSDTGVRRSSRGALAATGRGLRCSAPSLRRGC